MEGYRNKNPERSAQYQREYKIKNTARVLGYSARWMMAKRARDRSNGIVKTPEQRQYALNYQRKWYAMNRKRAVGYVMKYNSKKMKTCPMFKLRLRTMHRTRAVLSKVVCGIKGDAYLHYNQLIGCSAIELKEHIEKRFKDGMNWDAYLRSLIHIDHIRPCASFDLSDPEQQKACFHYTNLQPLWAKDNLKKGAKIIYEHPHQLLAV